MSSFLVNKLDKILITFTSSRLSKKKNENRSPHSILVVKCTSASKFCKDNKYSKKNH